MRQIEAYQTRPADEGSDNPPLVVLLHGRGSDETDLVGLGGALMPSALTVTPRAPFPAEPWGYGTGWAWYRIGPGFEVVADTLDSSLAALDEFLDRLTAELTVGDRPLVLGGFSQGGTLSQAYALTRPGRVTTVLNFSGFLAEPEGVEITPEGVAGTSFYWAHGRLDPAVPFELARTGRERLLELGARLEARDYQIGHWIDPGELKEAGRWLEGELAALRSR